VPQPSPDLERAVSEAPPTPGPTPSESPSDAKPTFELPDGTTPYLLVMPSAEPGSTAIQWPGSPSQPAWAIPVSIPAGTRGYAVFVPLVDGSAVAAPAVTADAAPVEAVRAETSAVEVAPSEPAAADDSGSAEPAPTMTIPPAPNVSPPITTPVGGFAPRPPQQSFLDAKWPGPAQAPGWAVPGGVLAGALGCAVFVPMGRTGIGWLLGGLALTIGVLVAVWRAAASERRTERLIRVAWAVAALALLSVLTFRNAWWLVTFCVLGALGCAALAILGGRMTRSILFSLMAAPFAAFRGLPWVTRNLRVRRRDGTNIGVGRRIFWSVVVTATVLAVFGALLSSADAAFSQVLRDLTPEINAGTVFGWIFLFVVGGLTAVAAVYTVSAPVDLSAMDKPGARLLGLLEWALPIGALVVLFGGFVAVQLTVLFGGQRHVLETAGLSYADYARSGFWQLVAVTLLTLAILAGVTRWANRDRPADRMVLRILLGLLSALTIVIVVSALFRMYTYQKVYSFTGERIFVMAFELLLGAVFVMILAAGIRWRGAWIPRLTVALGVVMLLSLAVINAEDYAARRNIDRYQETGKIDAWYLRALSADATPALSELPDVVRRCTLSWIAAELAEPDPWYAWNLGRVRAREVLAQIGPGGVGGPSDCRAADQFDLPKTR